MARFWRVWCALAVVAALLLAQPGVGAQGVRSGGIGLTRDAWEAAHGPGDPGQSVVAYEDGTYYVGYDGGRVAFVEVGWEDRGGLQLDDAEAAVEELLPSDARAVEEFAFPPTAAGPVGLVAVRYESRALAELFGDGRTGSIQAVFQTTGLVDPIATRASIAVGTER